MAKQKPAPSKDYGPISQKPYPARIDPDAMTAIEAYQAWMLNEHNLMVSTNKAINALVICGMQYIKDATESDTARKQARKAKAEATK